MSVALQEFTYGETPVPSDKLNRLVRMLNGTNSTPQVLNAADDAAYAFTAKNSGAGGKVAILYAADGVTPLLQVDAGGVRASRVGGAAERVLTTGESGTLTTAMLADGAVSTAKLAANAASQYQFAQSSLAAATISTVFVAMPNTTTPAMTTTGGILLFWGSGSLTHDTANGIASLGIQLDSGGYTSLQRLVLPVIGQPMPFSFIGLSLPAAGVHTLNIGWATNVGTLSADGIVRSLIVVELKR